MLDYNALTEFSTVTAPPAVDIEGDEKQEKSRERNREHAKKTRLRKKAMLEHMKDRLLELQNEVTSLSLAYIFITPTPIRITLIIILPPLFHFQNTKLKHSFEERSTANILLGLCSDENDTAMSESLDVEQQLFLNRSLSMQQLDAALLSGNIIEDIQNHVRAEASTWAQRFPKEPSTSSSNTGAASDSASDAVVSVGGNEIENSPTEPEVNNRGRRRSGSVLSSDCGGQASSIATSSNESSASKDDDTDEIGDNSIRTMTVSFKKCSGPSAPEDLASYRKERSRIHAKLTRDRKKLFAARMEQMIHLLEKQNSLIRGRLSALGAPVGSGGEGSENASSDDMEVASGSGSNDHSNSNSSNRNKFSNCSESVGSGGSGGSDEGTSSSGSRNKAKSVSSIPLTVGDESSAAELHTGKNRGVVGTEWWRVLPQSNRESDSKRNKRKYADEFSINDGDQDRHPGFPENSSRSSSSPTGSREGSDSGHPSGSDEGSGATDSSVGSTKGSTGSSASSGQQSSTHGSSQSFSSSRSGVTGTDTGRSISGSSARGSDVGDDGGVSGSGRMSGACKAARPDRGEASCDRRGRSPHQGSTESNRGEIGGYTLASKNSRNRTSSEDGAMFALSTLQAKKIAEVTQEYY